MTAAADEAAFLAAILGQPADDTARLVYADWLEEHGDGISAGFIRRAIQDPRAVHLVPLTWLTRVELILGCQPHQAARKANREASTVASGYVALTYRRGFVAQATLLSEAWEEHGGALLTAHPIECINLPRVRVELSKTTRPCPWQAVYYEPGASTWNSCSEWPTRAEMVAGVLSDVRALEAEFA